MNSAVSKFSKEDLPFDVMEQFGLSETEIEALPDEVLEKFLAGYTTPPFILTYTDPDGEIYRFKSRLALVEQPDGTPELMFYPELPFAPIECYTAIDQMNLKEGRAIGVKGKTPEGIPTFDFLQLDQQTQHLMSVPGRDIGPNLEILQNALSLKSEDIEAIREGAPVTIKTEKGIVTIGFDFAEDSCLRICDGGLKDWINRGQKSEPTYTLGMSGCWVSDVDGVMYYVNQENYTQDIINAVRQQYKK